MNPLSRCFLYGILDLGYVPPDKVAPVTAQLLQGGVDLLQLRAKKAPKTEILKYAEAMLPLTKAAGVPLILNDYPELLREIVMSAFSQRRKLLRHTFGRWLEARGADVPFDVQRRAEEVPGGYLPGAPPGFLIRPLLARIVCERASSGSASSARAMLRNKDA